MRISSGVSPLVVSVRMRKPTSSVCANVRMQLAYFMGEAKFNGLLVITGAGLGKMGYSRMMTILLREVVQNETQVSL